MIANTEAHTHAVIAGMIDQLVYNILNQGQLATMMALVASQWETRSGAVTRELLYSRSAAMST